MFSLIIYLDIYFLDSNILRTKDTRWNKTGLVSNVIGLRDFVTQADRHIEKKTGSDGAGDLNLISHLTQCRSERSEEPLQLSQRPFAVAQGIMVRCVR